MIGRAGRGRFFLHLAVLIGLTLGSGCAHSNPERFYVLTGAPRSTGAPPPAVTATGTGAAAVGIGPVSLPSYLDRIQIVTRRGAQLEVAEFDRWGEPLSEGVPRALAANLAALLQSERVVVYPWPVGRTVELQVVVDVTRFDGVVGGDVLLEARWRVFARDRKELLLRSSTVRETTGGPGYLALVSAMDRSLAALSREIADSIRELPTR